MQGGACIHKIDGLSITHQDMAAAGIHCGRLTREWNTTSGRCATHHRTWADRVLLFGTGALRLQIVLDAPVFFPLLTGLFELLLLAIAADLWLGTKDLTVDCIRSDAGKLSLDWDHSAIASCVPEPRPRLKATRPLCVGRELQRPARRWCVSWLSAISRAPRPSFEWRPSAICIAPVRRMVHFRRYSARSRRRPTCCCWPAI